jgi:hypothetical protein
MRPRGFLLTLRRRESIGSAGMLRAMDECHARSSSEPELPPRPMPIQARRSAAARSHQPALRRRLHDRSSFGCSLRITCSELGTGSGLSGGS